MTACVASQEDHGFALSFGIEGLSGFLSNKHVDGNGELPEFQSLSSYSWILTALCSIENLKPGHLIYCSVVSINEARKVALVSLEQTILSTSQPKLSETILLECLTPGLLLSGKVQHITSTGLVISFYGIFEGVVDMFHTGKRLVDDNLDSHFKIEQKVSI